MTELPDGVTITPPTTLPNNRMRRLLKRSRNQILWGPDERWRRHARLVRPADLQPRVKPTRRTNG